jgi:hypothetical protein
MDCPKCNRQNHDQAQICLYCHHPLLYVPAIPPDSDTRTSKLAIASCILGVIGLPIFFMRGSLAMQGHEMPPLSILACASLLSALLAVFLGLAALACIEINYGRLTGRAFAAIGIAIPLIAYFLTAAHASLANMRGTAVRITCSTNLSGLGKAMLIYANDYDDELPRAGGPNSTLGTTADFQANNQAGAYGLTNGKNGQASMSANFYLLVKYAEVTPKGFKCDKDRAFKEFKLAGYKVGNKKLIDLWDFGPDPAKHVSFSYHIPYGNYGLTSSNLPGMAIAADRNPWLASPGGRRSKTDFQAFDPNGTRAIIKRANALPHKGNGQNVLFIDGHTSFEKQPFCGVKDDNIYTPQTATDVKKGAVPTLTSQPANKTDSLLLHDPPKGAKK